MCLSKPVILTFIKYCYRSKKKKWLLVRWETASHHTTRRSDNLFFSISIRLSPQVNRLFSSTFRPCLWRMRPARRGGKASRDLPLVVQRRPPFAGRGLSHSSLSWRGVPPIHQACQQWHPFPLRARRLGTSGLDCIADTHREQHTDTLMDSFIRPFITQGANGKSQCTEYHSNAMLLLPSRPADSMEGQNNLLDNVSLNTGNHLDH